MNYFEFTKRFPDENSAIDFIVATKYKDGYVCPKCGAYTKESIIKTMIEGNCIATTANRSSLH